MNPEEIRKAFEALQKTVNEFKTEHETALATKAEGSEINQKLERITADIAKQAEEYNDRLAKIQALSTAIITPEMERLENAKKLTKAFNQFARDESAVKVQFDAYLKSSKEFNALTTDSDPDGGYTVLPTYAQMRMTRNFETSPIRQLASQITIGTNELCIPVDYDQFAVTDAQGERQTVSATNTGTIGMLKIPVYKIIAAPRVSEEMLADSNLNVESWVSNKVDQRFTRVENTNFVSGNGVERARGFLSYAAWTSAGTFEHGKLEQINSGSASTVTADGLQDCQNSLIEIYQPNAVWLMRRATFGAIAKLKDGNGNYLFNRNLEMGVGVPFSLLGAPVRFAADMPAIASNALAIAYGDFREGYQIVDRAGLSVLRDPYSTKGYVEFYSTRRVGGAVVNFEAIKIQKISA